MLKITVVDTPDAQRLVLEGRLAEPWLSEFKTSWGSACKSRGGRNCIIDLNGVTYIDTSGEEALLEMRNEGAQLVARGICNKHKLQDIENRFRNNFDKATLKVKEPR